MNSIARRPRRGRLRLAGTALLVSVGLGLAACSPTGSEGAPHAAAPVTTPASESAPTLVSGTVSRNGDPLPDTPVAVQIWSNEDIEIGESVDMHEIGPVLTDEQGRYAIVLDRADLAPEYVEGEDIVNFDVGVTEPFIAPVSTSVELTEHGSWSAIGAEDVPKTMDFDLGTMKATEDNGDGSTSRWPLVQLG